MRKVKPIPIQNLLIDLQNPRYDPRTNQREALATLAREQGSKLVSLAEDVINEGGLNPAELPMVMPSGDGSSFIVMEGNRRITALKLLLSPSLTSGLNLPDNLLKKLKSLHDSAKEKLPSEILCVVFESREEARHWIDLRHTGENGGVGIVSWDGVQTQRFRGSSASLQAVEYARHSNLLDEDTKKKLPKIAITNIERVLNTPDARKILGVEVKNNELIFKDPEEIVIPRLATIVSDIANKRKKVTHLDTKDQRIEYAKEVVENPAQKTDKSSSANNPKGFGSSITNPGKPGKGAKSLPVHRKTLIPKGLGLTITVVRLNKIFDELKRLDVSLYANSCAVLFRVFLELSVDEFAETNNIFLKLVIPSRVNTKGERIPESEKEFSLREKIKTVADYMEINKVCEVDELRGVRMIVSNRDHVLSIDSLNAYVHNRNISPSDTDLKTTWDNLEVFIKRLWGS
ncbi:MAG: hypothetical protein HYZ24_03865 [Chloroflexi bacterium]|jgi:hypothetical protein|nr:hypothetical protein [Chloroflexota bacterium]